MREGYLIGVVGARFEKAGEMERDYLLCACDACLPNVMHFVLYVVLSVLTIYVFLVQTQAIDRQNYTKRMRHTYELALFEAERIGKTV